MTKVRRRYHFGLPSVLYLGATLLVGIGASNAATNNLLFLVFGLAVGALVVSGLISGTMMMGIRVKRVLPDAASAGRPTSVAYEITNKNKLMPLFGLRVEEAVRVGRRSKGARPTWPTMMSPAGGPVLHVGRGETVRVRCVVTPHRRGCATFDALRVSSGFPFGILRKSVTFSMRDSLDVYPRLLRLRREIASSLLSQGTYGATTVDEKGSGDEFYGLREYQAGDSLRRIAWKSTARTGNVVVREHTRESGGRIWIMLNIDPRDDSREIESAISIGASLAVDALQIGSEVGLIAPAQGLVCPINSGSKHRLALLSALARLDPSAGPERAVDGAEAGRMVSRAACVVIHSGDLDPSVAPAHARHVVAADAPRLAVDDREDQGLEPATNEHAEAPR